MTDEFTWCNMKASILAEALEPGDKRTHLTTR